MLFTTTAFMINFAHTDQIWVTSNDINETQKLLKEQLEEAAGEEYPVTMTVFRDRSGRRGFVESLKVRVPRDKHRIDRRVRELLTSTERSEVESVEVKTEVISDTDWLNEDGDRLDPNSLDH